MSQIDQLKEILRDRQKHCSAEFVEKMFIVDYRRRICDIREELRSEGKTVASEPCRGRCGRNHKANVSRYWIEPLGQSRLF